MDKQLIFQKIPAIMREIEPIAKGRKNAQQGYAYRGVDDVMNELSPILAKHSVFPVTTISTTAPMEAITSKTGTGGYHAVRTYGFRLYAEDGSYVEGAVEGEASDFGDKAAGKAHSYAYRDFLMKTFCIPTEGDHDTDAHTPEIKPTVSKAPQPPKPKQPELTPELEKQLTQSVALLDNISDMDKLKAVWDSMPELWSNEIFKQSVNNAKKRLTNGK